MLSLLLTTSGCVSTEKPTTDDSATDEIPNTPEDSTPGNSSTDKDSNTNENPSTPDNSSTPVTPNTPEEPIVPDPVPTGKKVLLVSIDGLRSDAFAASEAYERLVSMGCYTLNARTINPSITLPAHFSMFYGVGANIHGVTTNSTSPSSMLDNGITETVITSAKSTAMILFIVFFIDILLRLVPRMDGRAAHSGYFC